MSEMTKVMGKDLMLFADGKAIALATSCKLTITADMQESANKDSGVWNDNDVSKLGYEGSSDSLFTNDPEAAPNVHTALVKKMIAGEAVDLTFGVVGNPSTAGVPEGGWTLPKNSYYKGKAKIKSVDFNGANGDKATMSVSFVGCGELSVVESASV